MAKKTDYFKEFKSLFESMAQVHLISKSISSGNPQKRFDAIQTLQAEVVRPKRNGGNGGGFGIKFNPYIPYEVDKWAAMLGDKRTKIGTRHFVDNLGNILDQAPKKKLAGRVFELDPIALPGQPKTHPYNKTAGLHAEARQLVDIVRGHEEGKVRHGQLVAMAAPVVEKRVSDALTTKADKFNRYLKDEDRDVYVGAALETLSGDKDYAPMVVREMAGEAKDTFDKRFKDDSDKVVYAQKNIALWAKKEPGRAMETLYDVAMAKAA